MRYLYDSFGLEILSKKLTNVKSLITHGYSARGRDDENHRSKSDMIPRSSRTPIMWSAKTQKAANISVTDAEFSVLAACTQEVA